MAVTGANGKTPAESEDAARAAALDLAAALDELVEALAGSRDDVVSDDCVRRLAIVAAEMEHAAIHCHSMDRLGIDDAYREVEVLLLGCARGGSPRVVASRARVLAASRAHAAALQLTMT
jgi:hypothetical protein